MPLTLEIKGRRLWDEKNEIFYEIKPKTITMEHSLVSISKWEQKWHKPFLDKNKEKTREEMIHYIECMTITQNVDPLVYLCISPEQMDNIKNYIEDPRTATWFGNDKSKGPGKDNRIVTNELIYCWMFSSGVPKECEKWHINHLLTLLRVIGEENKPDKKMSKEDTYALQARLNAERRAKSAAKRK